MTQNIIESKNTILTEQEAAYALIDAWKRLYNEIPNEKQLAILLAQCILETGHFKFCKNFNFGNVKASNTYDGYVQYYKASEIINGKEVFFYPPHPQTRFRAFLSASDGAFDYILFLQNKRYTIAVTHLKNGDVIRYTTALSVAGYFTASLTKYLKIMQSLYDKLVKVTPDYLLGHAESELKAVDNTTVDVVQVEEIIEFKECDVIIPPPPKVPEDFADTIPSAPNFKPKANIAKTSAIIAAVIALLYMLERLFQ